MVWVLVGEYIISHLFYDLLSLRFYLVSRFAIRPAGDFFCSTGSFLVLLPLVFLLSCWGDFYSSLVEEFLFYFPPISVLSVPTLDFSVALKLFLALCRRRFSSDCISSAFCAEEGLIINFGPYIFVPVRLLSRDTRWRLKHWLAYLNYS